MSKDQHLQQIREIDERCYIAISDDFDYYQYEVRLNNTQSATEFKKKLRKDGTECTKENPCHSRTEKMF